MSENPPSNIGGTDQALHNATTPVADQALPALVFSTGTYEALRVLVQILLPGVATLYTALSAVWNWGHTDQVLGTLAALTVFLGLILGVARRSYNKSDAQYDGVIHVTETDDGVKKAALVLKNYENPSDVVNQKSVTFKVTGQK